MIKSLLEPDEPESNEKTENLTEERKPETDALRLPFQNALKKSEQIPMVESLPEKNNQMTESFGKSYQPDQLESRLAEIESLSESELDKLLENENLFYSNDSLTNSEQNAQFSDPYTETKPAVAKSVYDEVVPIENVNISQNKETNPPVVKPKDYTPETMAEGIRQSGMAWSAAIVLFGSVVFFMIIGWFADLLLGTAPWSLVAGIVIGGIMGFVQFFRISSKIFKPQQSEFERTSLRGNERTEVIEVVEVVQTVPTNTEN